MLSSLNNFKPNSKSATPLYLQLANSLSAAIHDGTLRPDEALPSERILSENLSISRVTARKAIDMLCNRGLLIKKQGSGTFIMPKTEPAMIEQPLSRLTNFSEQLSQRGFVPGSQWISRQTGIASVEEILSLGISPNTVVSRLKRLRTADKVVVAIENTTILTQYLPDPKLVTDSLYNYLDITGAAPVRALQHIRAVNATPEQAKLTGIAEGAAMIFITRIGYHANGAAIELTHSFCHGDYYDFVAELFK